MVASWRERESELRSLWRERNEATARAPATLGGERAFRCECGDRRCRCAIALTLPEYSLIRAYATRFAIAQNHENPESEQLIEENERFAVVETVTPEATKLARRSDPRQRVRETRWPTRSHPVVPGQAR